MATSRLRPRRMAPVIDDIIRRQRHYARLVEPVIATIDPTIEIQWADGEVFEGPVVCLVYPVACAVPRAEQEHALSRAADELRKRGLPISFVRSADDAVVPFIEIACDIELHKRMLLTYARADPDQRRIVMEIMGVPPNTADLTREAWYPHPESD